MIKTRWIILAGSLFLFADGAYSDGIITTAAGGGPVDGTPAVEANLALSTGTNASNVVGLTVGIAADNAGNFFIPAPGQNKVFRVDASGIITTVAGNGSYRFNSSDDGGAATSAGIGFPNAVAVDAVGNLYIAQAYGLVRKVDTAGIMTTVAGCTLCDTVGELATNSRFVSISGLTIDGAGNLYIRAVPDLNGVGGTLTTYKIDPSGVITAVVDNINGNNSIAFDTAGNKYVAYQCHVEKTDTQGNTTVVAGDATSSGLACGFSGDGGLAVDAKLYNIGSLAVDAVGNLYIDDTRNQRIRKVDTSGIITTVAGDGDPWFSGDGGAATRASLKLPSGVAFDPVGNMYIADFGNLRIRKVDVNGVITTIGLPLGSVPPFGLPDTPIGIAVDTAGNVYYTYGNVYKMDPSGNVVTIAGNGTSGYSGDGGPATSAQLNGPTGLAVDAVGNLYISDTGNNHIRKVGNDGIITTVLGLGLSHPLGITVDAAGNLYVADQWNERVLKRTATGTVSVVAGTGSLGYNGNGIKATSAYLWNPAGVTVDSNGNLFIIDSGNERIRKVGTNGIITTIAGYGGYDSFSGPPFSGDGGRATQAGVNFTPDLRIINNGNLTFALVGLAMDGAGNLYFSDIANDRIRRVGAVEEPSPTPDLIMTAVGPNTNVLKPGQSLAVSNTVSNQGDVAAGSFTIAFHLSPNTTYGDSDDIVLSATRSVTSLSPLATGTMATSTRTASTTLTIPSTTPVGTYYICAMADSANAVDEGAFENNNTFCSASPVTVTYPDLVMTDVTPGATTVNQGASLTGSSTVQNQGLVASGSSTVAFHLSVDNIYGNADDIVLSGTRSVAGLAAGASSSGSATLKVPASTPPNTYYLCAMADKNNSVVEIHEDNNTKCSTTQVTVPNSDLIVSAVSTTATTATAGKSVYISNSIKNQGGSKSGSFVVAFHLSTNPVYGDGDDVVSTKTRMISALAIGGTNTASTSVTIPSTTPAGTYYMCVKADDTDTVTELDETNNTACTSTTITVQ